MVNRLWSTLLLCLASAIFLSGLEDNAQSGKAKKIEGRSRYAPYWYVDDATDSFLELKSHFQKSSISLLPTLTLLDGQRVKVGPVTVPPLATVRVSLKQQLFASQVSFPRSSARTKSSDRTNRWGDGSRPNSLVGAIQLDVISPQAATANDFNGWIRIENHVERLGALSMLENPSSAIGTTLEGLWWAPYPETQVYFALQNTTQSQITVQLTLADEKGRQIKTTSLEVAKLGARLINVRELLSKQLLPQVGSASFGTSAKPGAIVARGRLLQEQMRFSASWKLQEAKTFTEGPANTQSELHAPAAYFGKLNRLSHRGEAYLHPHLLLKNVSKRQIAVIGVVYGKDQKGLPTKLNIQPLTLGPNDTVHVDLEQARQKSQSTLGDGPAGLQLSYAGAPTDIVAELLSVDTTGQVVFYDDIRSRFLHQATIQSAISFDLSNDNQSFLIIKNTTNEPRKVDIRLDYNEGKDHYDIAMSEIPAQQNAIVDIQDLRDSRVPDVNGRILPPNVTFGGSVIFSEPGAFVISDPTLVYGHTNAAGQDPPDGTPFFLPSCGRDLSLSDERPPPRNQCCEWESVPAARQTCEYIDYVCTQRGIGCNVRKPRLTPSNVRDCCPGAACSIFLDICPSPPPPAVCRQPASNHRESP
jgi:hypothetical protein